MTDPTFPFANVHIRFQIDGAPPEGWVKAIVEGHPNRQWTTCQPMSSFYWREAPTQDEIAAQARSWWNKVKDEVHGPKSYGPEGTPKYPNYSDVEINIGPIQYESWIPSWFSHITYSEGRSDRELLDSFERYVDHVRRTHENWEGRLMGAEDRWRWTGDAKAGSPPPCRCKHCQDAGIVRIDH